MAEHNWNHIRTVLQDQGFRCQLVDHSEDLGMISIQGPKRWGERWRVQGEELRTAHHRGRSLTAEGVPLVCTLGENVLVKHDCET